MKKRTLKSLETSDLFSEVSSDSENLPVVEEKKERSKRRKTSSKKNKSTTDEPLLLLAEESEHSIDANSVDSLPSSSKRKGSVKITSSEAKVKKTSSTKKLTKAKKNVSGSSESSHISTEETHGPSDGISGVPTCEEKNKPRKSSTTSVKKKSVKASSETKKVGKSTTKRIRKKSPSSEIDNASTSVWENIKRNIQSVKLSETEIERRRQYQELTQNIQVFPKDVGYVGNLPYWLPGWLIVQGAREHNLKSIDVPFPLSAFTVVTGVSGSGKSSLVEDVLHRYLVRALSHSQSQYSACDSIVGFERIDKVIKVDQAPIGQTPTSNAATYTGVFDLIRQLYSQLPEAKLRRYSPRRFSFNVPGGRCEKCEGSGILKVEMHFLADVFITCDACRGKRYDSETLQIKFRGKSISDVLEMTCAEALELFSAVPQIAQILQTLCDVGLDYLPLGQSATTLSGGEAQRIKLAAELYRVDSGRTLYILDEPTTGLHFEDVRKLLDVLQRLVDLGNTVVVVEHNLDVIKNADWLIEIGPEAGLEGGKLVFAGTPEQLIEYTLQVQNHSESSKNALHSYTGEALIPIFQTGVFEERTVLDPQTFKKAPNTIQKTDNQDLAKETPTQTAEVDQPWDIDGKRWHTEFRTTSSGVECKWDGRALTAIVEKLEEYSCLAETNWGHKAFVEIRSESNSSIWFMQADTNEEWLLSLKFHTGPNTFKTESLSKSLALKPLKELQEVPLYGTLPRVKIENTPIWQEISLKVYSLSEIDTPEFTEFLKQAVESFDKKTKLLKGDTSSDLTPWKSQGRDWHLSTSGFYGASKQPRWTLEMLRKVLDTIESIAKDVDVVWTNKIAIPYSISKIQSPWTTVFTKNASFLCVQINFPQGGVDLQSVGKLGYSPQIEPGESNTESLYLRFKTPEELDVVRLLAVLKDSYQKFKERAAD